MVEVNQTITSENSRIKYVRVDDIDIAYKTFGQGQPIVLIMGMWGTMDLWAPGMLEALASNYRVIVFDNRGMGFTTASDKDFSMELFADDTAGLIAALGYERAHVLGWSLGACVAQEVALRHPGKTDKLILYAGSCGGEEAVPSALEIEELIQSRATSEQLIRSMFPASWNERHPDLREYYPEVKEKSSPESKKRQLQADDNWNGSFNRLSQIACPTLVITGVEDLDAPIRNAVTLAEAISGAWFIPFKNAGHGLMYQEPERFSQAIRAFLEIA